RERRLAGAGHGGGRPDRLGGHGGGPGRGQHGGREGLLLPWVVGAGGRAAWGGDGGERGVGELGGRNPGEGPEDRRHLGRRIRRVRRGHLFRADVPEEDEPPARPVQQGGQGPRRAQARFRRRRRRRLQGREEGR